LDKFHKIVYDDLGLKTLQSVNKVRGRWNGKIIIVSVVIPREGKVKERLS